MKMIEQFLDSIGCNPDKFIESCEWMGKGMLAIIIVMAVIILITTLLNKIPSKDSDNK